MKDKLSALLTDTEFEKIELSLFEPNIFKALSIERMELRHSNFLAYLLDPNSNHGLNGFFLKKVLRDVFLESKNKRTIFDVESIDLSVVEVRREWRNIDILIILRDDVIVIENKVDTMDHSDQLMRYKGIIDNAFPDMDKHFVFLTPFGVDPEDEKARKIYMNYSYLRISEIMQSVLSVYSQKIPTKVFSYISDYKRTIDLEFLMNDELNKMALKLYRAHKEALNFIFENRPDPASILYPYFETELKRKEYIIGSKKKGFIRFISSELSGLFSEKYPDIKTDWSNNEPFLIEIDYFWTENVASIKATISPCSNPNLSNKIWKAVEEFVEKKVSEKVGGYTRPQGKKWLVFFNKKIPFNALQISNEDPKEITTAISKLIDDNIRDICAIFSIIEEKFRNEQFHD